VKRVKLCTLRECRVGGNCGIAPCILDRSCYHSLSLTHTHLSMLYAREGPWNPTNRYPAPVPVDIRTLDSPFRSIGTIPNTPFRVRVAWGVIIIKPGIVSFRPLYDQLQFDSSEQPIGRTTDTKYKIQWTRLRSTATVAANTASRPPHAPDTPIHQVLHSHKTRGIWLVYCRIFTRIWNAAYPKWRYIKTLILSYSMRKKIW
jgi:hypothetical protein